MKKLLLMFGLVSLCTFSMAGNEPEKRFVKTSPIRFPKELNSFTGEMVYIPSGSFFSELSTNDSTARAPQEFSVQAFYMSKTEVTNLQYRTFYLDMINLVGKDSADFYRPDSNAFSRDIAFGYTEPMRKHYLSHEAYNDYPVIGVSWYQAKGYVEWLNYKMNEQIKLNPDFKKETGINYFRIPTEIEWEYAAKGGKDRVAYSWGNNFMEAEKNKIVWNGNFGEIKDENGVLIKSFTDDNAFFIAKADDYSPNDFGLYNMSGNVNEWVSDTYIEGENKLSTFRYNKTDEGLKKFMKYSDSEFNPATDKKIIKGGGFLDSPLWCMTGSRRAFSPETKKCDVGFRICTTFFYSE